jgi:hypothetical protein
MGLTGVILSIAEFEWFYDNGYVSYWYNDVLRSLVIHCLYLDINYDFHPLRMHRKTGLHRLQS